MLELFKRKVKKFKFEKDNIPSFKYHKDPLATDAIKLNIHGERCSCCNSLSKYIYLEPYFSEVEITCLCPDCIKSGEAHLKFDMEFQDINSCEEVKDKSIIEEVCFRTPGYASWQQEKWLGCCDDLCEFIGCLSWSEIKKLNIENEILNLIKDKEEFKGMGLPIEDIICAINNGDIDCCVFRCLHCKEYKVDLNMS